MEGMSGGQPFTPIYQLGLVVPQEHRQGVNANQSCHRCRLVRVLQHLVVDEPPPRLHNLNITVLDLPELPFLEPLRTLLLFDLHTAY